MKRILGVSVAAIVGLAFGGCGSSGDNGGKPHQGSLGPDGGDGTGDGSAAAGGDDGGMFLNVGSGGGPGSGAGGGKAAGGAASNAGGTTGAGGKGGPVTSVTPITPASACVSDKSQATNQPVDLFIMEDRSQSMTQATSTGDSKWTAITDALGAFVADPASAGIGAGIGFFSIDDSSGNMSCAAADYAKPAVGIAALNGNANAIKAAIQNTNPGGNTPTEPALQGAIDYAAAWQKAHPTHKVIVIFATDGLPNGCNSTVAGAVTIARAGAKGPPPIPTYVVGVFGSRDCPNGLTPQCTAVQNLNSIAKGGGTGSAFIIDTGGATATQFQDAMNAIRTANAASCDYTIPPPPSGKAIDPSHAAVEYTSGTKAPVGIPWVTKAATCSTTKGGWYYDSVTSPNKIHLCPVSCTTVQADTTAKIQVLLACAVPPPPGTGGGGGTPGSGGAGGKGGGGTAGAGGTGTGSGGSGTGGPPACLLLGQSCSVASDCCTGICSAGVCARLR